MKKSLTCFLVLALVFTGFITSNAKINEPDIAEILKLYADSINQKNEDEYLSLFHPEYYKDSKDALDFYRNQELKVLPFFVMSDIEIKNYTVISVDKLLKDKKLKTLIYNMSFEIDSLPNDVPYKIVYFYHTATVPEKERSTIAINGENLRVILLTFENDVWKIGRITSAPVELLIKNEIKLNSEIEKSEENKSNKLQESLIVPMRNFQMAYVQCPSSLRVKFRRTDRYNGLTNYEYWGVPYDGVSYVPTADYIRDVLPNEWDSDLVVPDSSNSSTYKLEALKAGSILVRSFTWYMIMNPWDPNNNIHVNDWASQCYLHNTRNKTSKDARGVSFNWGTMCCTAFTNAPYAVLTISTWRPYFCQYWQAEQNYTYNNNSLGFEVIVDSVYTTPGLNFYNPSLYSQYDILYFLNP